MKLGRLYVASVVFNRILSQMDGVLGLIFVLSAFPAGFDCLQSVAMVLFYAHTFQLLGDHIHDRCSRVLAMAMVTILGGWGRGG